MENQPKTSKRSVMLNYGLMLGIATIIISVLNYAFGDTYEPHWSINVISGLLMVAIIVLGIKKLKEFNDGYLTLGDAIKTGIGIAFIAAIISGIYIYIFANFIEGNFIDNIVELNTAKAIENSPEISDEILETQAEMTKEYFFVFTFGVIFIFNLFIGFVTSLIAGMIMKKTDEEITSI
jgi:nitrogen fixation/metabolism regulation signal transduction histidine kinase